MFRRAFFLTALALCVYQTKAQSSFYTIGCDHNRTKVTAKSFDTEEYTKGNICKPSADSMKVFLPMVSLPLNRIVITSPFGIRRDPMDRTKQRYHSGLDLSAHYEDVFSMLPGTVTAASYSKTGGYYVTINHGVCSCSYLHLSKIRVYVGQHVNAGQVIATSGNTGSRTTGPHLHLSCRLNNQERKYFDPMLILGFVSDQILKYQQIK